MPSSVCYPDAQRQNPESRELILVINWPKNCISSSMPIIVWSPDAHRQNPKSHEPIHVMHWLDNCIHSSLSSFCLSDTQKQNLESLKLYTQFNAEQCLLPGCPEAKSQILWTPNYVNNYLGQSAHHWTQHLVPTKFMDCIDSYRMPCGKL